MIKSFDGVEHKERAWIFNRIYLGALLPAWHNTKPCSIKKREPEMVAPDKKTLKKSVKSMFFMVQTRCEVETIKY